MIRLDGRAGALASTQQINEPDLGTAYGGGQGIDAYPEKAWSGLTDRLVENVRREVASITVPVALFTLTAEEASGISAIDLGRINAELGVTKSRIDRAYGEVGPDNPGSKGAKRGRLEIWLPPMLLSRANSPPPASPPPRGRGIAGNPENFKPLESRPEPAARSPRGEKR